MDFNRKSIDELLEKYWAAESSLEEEAFLKSYFEQENIADEHRAYASLFRDDDQLNQLDDKFDRELFMRIEREERSNSGNGIWRLVSYAASIALLVAIGWWITDQNAQSSEFSYSKDTYEDPQVAYEEVREQLLFVSNLTRKGTEPVSHIKKLNTPQDILIKE